MQILNPLELNGVGIAFSGAILAGVFAHSRRRQPQSSA